MCLLLFYNTHPTILVEDGWSLLQLALDKMYDIQVPTALLQNMKVGQFEKQ